MTHRLPRRHRLALLGSISLLVMPWAAALPAQAADDPAEQVVVTARKRTERLQSVPVAVTVISGNAARQRNLNTLEDIAQTTPSVTFRSNASAKDRTLLVRGIGTVSTSQAVEPSVATVVDGVVLARSGQAAADLIDVDRIEILRGPQGTLFGKNASAGVVNIITRTPDDQFRAYADAGYFSGGDEYRLDGGVSGALGEHVAASLAALVSGYQGQVDNRYLNTTAGGYQHDGMRAKLVYTGEDTRLILAADYLRAYDTVPNGIPLSAGPALTSYYANYGVVPAADNRNEAANDTTRMIDNTGGLSLTAETQLGTHRLTSITAWRIWDNDQRADFDQTPVLTTATPQGLDQGHVRFNQVSQELRIDSPKGGMLDYVTGLYFMHTDDSETYSRVVTTCAVITASPCLTPASPKTGDASFGTTNDNVALFGEANLHPLTDLTLIAGLRGIYDTVDFHHQRVTNSAGLGISPSFAASGSTDHTDVAARAGAQYQISPDIMSYFTYSRGYKGPAYNVFFNMAASDTAALKPETSNAYELGLKSTFFAQRLRANFAGFIEDFSDVQATIPRFVGGAPTNQLINAGSVKSQGVEGDIGGKPMRDLDLGTSFAYTESQVVQFNCVASLPSCPAPGTATALTPKWRVAVNAKYGVNLNDTYRLSFGTDWTWQSQISFLPVPAAGSVQPGYGIWNTDITLADQASRWRASFIIKNLLDKHYASYIVPGTLGGFLRYVPRDDHRYFGVLLHKDF